MSKQDSRWFAVCYYVTVYLEKDAQKQGQQADSVNQPGQISSQVLLFFSDLLFTWLFSTVECFDLPADSGKQRMEGFDGKLIFRCL